MAGFHWSEKCRIKKPTLIFFLACDLIFSVLMSYGLLRVLFFIFTSEINVMSVVIMIVACYGFLVLNIWGMHFTGIVIQEQYNVYLYRSGQIPDRRKEDESIYTPREDPSA